MRVSVASAEVWPTDVLTKAEENLDLQTRKIRTISKDELNLAKTSGKCPQKLYAVIFAIGQKMFF